MIVERYQAFMNWLVIWKKRWDLTSGLETYRISSNIVNDVDVPSLRQGYASLCEKSRKYSEAVDHYKAAKNIKDAVRLYIDKVKNYVFNAMILIRRRL